MPLILIVEDDEDLVEIYKLSLDFALVVEARTVREAEEAFQRHEFSAVIMDGHVKGPEPITLRLVRRMRFLKPHLKIIATSSDDHLKEELMDAGCSESCNKSDVLEKLSDLFRAA